MLILIMSVVGGCSNSSNSTKGGFSGRNSKRLQEITAYLVKQAVQARYDEHDTVIEVDAIKCAKSRGKRYTGQAEVTMRNNETIEMYKLVVTFKMVYDNENASLELEQIKNL